MQIENKLAVLILCGGKGTRLGTKFKNTNKSLIKVNGKTLISTNINYTPIVCRIPLGFSKS